MKLRTIVKILGGLFALVLLALISLPFFISADFMKTQLAAQVKKATGRELVIKGDTSLVVFPAIAVSAEDVTLSNPEGFSGPYFVHLGKLKAGAALGPLLHQQLEITGITLEGMELNLEENKAGANNWEFSVEKAKEETQAKLEKSAASSEAKKFTMGEVTVKNSSVNYRKAGEAPIAIRDLNVTLNGADGHGPLTFDAGLRYQDQPLNAKLKLDSFKALMANKPSSVKASLELPFSNRLAFDGVMAMGDAPAGNGALTIKLDDTPKLLSWATRKPAGAMPKSVALDAKLAMKGMQSIILSDIALKADALSASGKLSINASGAVPSVQGMLHFAELDLDALMAQSSKGADAAPGNASANAVEGWSNAPIDASGLRAANLDLALRIDRLRSGKITISGIESAISLKSGLLKLALANAALYEGAAKGTVTVDGSGSGVGLATNLHFTNIQIEPLMTALSGRSRLKGTTNLSLDLNGRGASEQAIVNSLGGTSSLSVTNGAFKGINIAQFLRNAKQGFLFANNEEAATDFSELSAGFTIANGIVSNKDLSMKSPILRVAGSGTVSLPARSLNYRLVPSIVGSLEGQGGKEASGLAVPLVITGPWSNPSITPDVAGLIQEGLKNPEALKQNLKDIKGQLKNFNSPKDIGRALFGGQKEAPATPTAPDASPAATPAKPNLGDLLQGLTKKPSP